MSALIFVGVAVAWAAYLVPKALKHHDEAARSRSVERFSHTMRVLARREPINRRSARLVVTPGRSATSSKVETKPNSAAQAPQSPPAPAAPATPPLTPAQARARRAAAKRATKRRRNVLAVLALANLAVIAVAAFSVISWWYVAIPVGLLAAWLVACRLMVKSERAAMAPVADPSAEVASTPREASAGDAEFDGADPMADTSAGIAPVDPALWDPVPMTLPTYVTKPAATRRTVRTIDLDDSGVWTSGRTDADAQLAREADAADRADRAARTDGDDQQAVGT